MSQDNETKESYPGFYQILQPNSNKIFFGKAEDNVWVEMNDFYDSIGCTGDEFPEMYQDLCNYGESSFQCKIIQSSPVYCFNKKKFHEDFENYKSSFFKENPNITEYVQINLSSLEITNLTQSSPGESTQGDEKKS